MKNMIDDLYKISDIIENNFGGAPYTDEEQGILDSIDRVINFLEYINIQDTED